MAAGDLSLMIAIGASDSASSVISALGSSLGKLAGSGPLGAVAAAGVVAGAALVGFGVASVKAAGDFQAGMTSLVTGAGESESAIKGVSSGILKMATDTGTSTKQLTDGMYLIESAGFHGADGLKVLQAAAEGAKVGNADLKTVANAVTTTLTDYGMSADKSTSVTSGLVAAVAAGKTHMEDMGKALGAVLPVASSLHVSFPQVSGAIATMTAAGIPAEQAAQNLAHVMTALAAPNAVAAKSMKEVGLSAQDVKDALANQGLTGALQLIEDHVGKKFPAGSVEAVTALKNIMGGLVGFKTELALGGQHMTTFEANIKSISDAMNSGSKQVQGWDLVQKDMNFQIDRAKAAFEVLEITIGQKLLPIVTPLIKSFADFLGTLANVINGTESTGKAMGDLGKLVGGLASVFAPIVAVIKTLFIPALIALGAALLTLAAREIPGMILALLDFVHSMTAAAAASVATTGAAAASFKDMAGLIVGAIGEEVAAVTAAIGPFVLVAVAIAALVVAFKLMYDKIKPVHDAMNAIAKVATDVATAIGGALKAAFEAVIGVIGKVGSAIAPLIESFSKSKEATNLLIAALIGLSVAIIASLMPAILAFIATIPAIVTGLVAWAAAQLAVIAGALVLAAPFILIGLVVAAAIFAILEIITHWGEITTWLKAKWDDFAKGYQTLMQNIQKWDESVRKSIQDGWNSTMKHLSDNNARNNAQADKDWSTFAKTVQKWGDASDKNLEQAFNKMTQSGDKSTKDIAAAFQWLYDHNYYVQRFCDFITTSWEKTGKDVQKGDDAMRAYMTDTWTKNNQDAAKQWAELGRTIQSFDESTRKGVQDGWTATSKFLSDNWNKNSQTEDKSFSDMAKSVQKWGDESDSNIKQATANMLKSFAQWGQDSDKAINEALSNMARAIAGFWDNQVQPALGAFGQKWNSFWGGVITNAKEIGSNIIKAIADGFMGGVNYLSNAVHNAMSFSLGALGFHNIPGFAGGVENFAGGWAVVGERGPELVFLPSGSSVIPSGSPPPVAMSGSSGSSSSSSSSRGGAMVINMILDGRQIGKAATTYQEGELRVAGNLRSR